MRAKSGWLTEEPCVHQAQDGEGGGGIDKTGAKTCGERAAGEKRWSGDRSPPQPTWPAPARPPRRGGRPRWTRAGPRRASRPERGQQGTSPPGCRPSGAQTTATPEQRLCSAPRPLRQQRPTRATLVFPHMARGGTASQPPRPSDPPHGGRNNLPECCYCRESPQVRSLPNHRSSRLACDPVFSPPPTLPPRLSHQNLPQSHPVHSNRRPKPRCWTTTRFPHTSARYILTIPPATLVHPPTAPDTS